MSLTRSQRDSIEIITGKDWGTYLEEAIEAYFEFTDKGRQVLVSQEARADLEQLFYHHKSHAVTVEMWRSDFRKGLLFLGDFLLPETDFSGIRVFYPDRYIQHAFEVYQDEMGFIPKMFEGGLD